MRIQYRLLLGLITIILISILPLTIFSVRLVSESIDLWAQKDIEDTLEQAIQYAQSTEHYNKSKEALKIYRQLKAIKSPIKQQIINYSILLSIAAFFVSILLGWAFIIWIVKPLRALTKATRDVSSGNLLTNIDASGSPLEIKRLIKAFNQMTNSLKTNQDELNDVIRKRTWQKASMILSHGIKKPITPTRILLERIKEKYPNKIPDISEILNEASQFITEEMDNLTDEFLQIASSNLTQTPHDIVLLLEEILEGYAPAYPQINLRLKFGENIPRVLIDWKAMNIALSSVIQYRIECLDKSGDIDVGCYAAGDDVIIEISDVGKTGYDTAFRNAEWDICQDVINAHHGSVELQGNTCRIVLPVGVGCRL
jgi:nitrogen fixation/metabolism regulation signal transduction histidine kinase